MDERIRQLPSVYVLPEMVLAEPGEETIQVSDTVSKAAAVYEKFRNLLEYEEEHLLRRNAIRRNLKRRLGAEVDAVAFSRELITELIWARYLPNEQIPVTQIQTVADVLIKYDLLMQSVGDAKDGNLFNWLLDIMATEIESTLVPPKREDALASFMFRVIGDRIEWKKGSLPEDQRELQLFLAVHRTLLKADTPRLRSRVFNLLHPTWKKGPSQKEIDDIAERLPEIAQEVDAHVHHRIAEPLQRELRKYAVIFNVLFDIVKKEPDAFLSLVEDEATFKKEIAKATKDRMKNFKTRLRRLVIRAVVFLFFTKFLMAIAIELPYDLLIAHETSMLPLVVNVLFPPFLLAFIGLSIGINKKQNIANVQNGVNAVVYGTEDLKLVFKVKRPWNSGPAAYIFAFMYAVSFLFSYGVIGWVLFFFGFNIVSIAIFLFFLSLVTFFGIRIRNSRREVVVETGKSNVFGALVDIFMLPIIRVGRWISIKTPRVNVILFFMDFIIEAPFKMAIEMVESWLGFVREKKEEI